MRLSNKCRLVKKQCYWSDASRWFQRFINGLCAGCGWVYKAFPQYGIPTRLSWPTVRWEYVFFLLRLMENVIVITCFPSSTLLASTWDTPARGDTSPEQWAKEAAIYDVDVILTPGINIMKSVVRA